MQLTKHTDFAFRSLMYLSSSEGKKVKIKDISERFDIPQSHLMKVINALANAGYIDSTRGKNGGIALAKKPKDITVREIIMLMENTLEPLDCEGQACLLLKICKLKKALNQAKNAYLETLEKVTLEEISTRNVKKLLSSQ